jgi:predicted membrane chloride channel (bestrophin family)
MAVKLVNIYLIYSHAGRQLPRRRKKWQSLARAIPSFRRQICTSQTEPYKLGNDVTQFALLKGWFTLPMKATYRHSLPIN